MALTFGWVKALKKLVTPEKVRSVPVGDDPSHRVATGYKGKLLTTPRDGVATLYDISTSSYTGGASCGEDDPRATLHI